MDSSLIQKVVKYIITYVVFCSWLYIMPSIISHYEYLWQKRKGVDLQNIFEGLPVSLKADLALCLHKDLIEQV